MNLESLKLIVEDVVKKETCSVLLLVDSDGAGNSIYNLKELI